VVESEPMTMEELAPAAPVNKIVEVEIKGVSGEEK